MNTSSLAEPVVEVDAPPMPEASVLTASANSTAAACATAESPATAAPPATAASPATSTKSIRGKKRKRDMAEIFEEQLKGLNEKAADEGTLFGEEIANEMRKFKDPYKQAVTKRAIRYCIFFLIFIQQPLLRTPLAPLLTLVPPMPTAVILTTA